MTYVEQNAALPFLVSDSTAPDDTLRRAQAGDMRAFEELYRANVPRIYALCLRMTASVPAAEELTQQAFLHAWQKLRLFRADSAFSTWMHRLAVNVVLTHQRAEERRTQRVFGTDDPEAREPKDARSTALPGDRMDLETAIARLPAQARTIFVLHDVEGWKHHEIAAELGLSTGTTKAQLHRARKLLQEALR